MQREVLISDPKRAEGESPLFYQERRILAKMRERSKLKGRLIWNSSTQGTFKRKPKEPTQ